MNNTEIKITKPIHLKRELSKVDNTDIITGILRRAEWQIVMEMKESLFLSSFYTDIGERNENLCCLCLSLLKQVRHYHGGNDQTIIDKGLANKTINELLAPHDHLCKMATND